MCIRDSGQAAHGRGNHEQHHRGDKVALAPDSRGGPAGHRKHHAYRHQVARDHPGDPIDANPKTLLHVWESDVDDRPVKVRKNGAKHHRRGDEPLVRGHGLVFGE